MGLPPEPPSQGAQTGGRIEAVLPLAGLTRRVLARMLDQAVLLIVYLAIVAFGLLNVFNNPWISIAVCLVLLALADFVYFTLFHALANGQTPGKRVLGIRVVTSQGGDVDMITSVVRSLAGILDVTLFWGTVSALMILATEREQRIADFAADTIVLVRR